MKRISLTKDKFTIVDSCDFEDLSKHKWHYDGYYARATISGKQTRMHQYLLPAATMIDHINTDPLDNRRSNLRAVDKSKNMANRGTQLNNTSGFKGVHRRKVNGTFQAYIGSGLKRKNLGHYGTAVEAARAYDQAAKEVYGEFARLNNAR